MEYAYAFDENLCIEQTPDQVNINSNSLKQKYIERICTSMRCSTTLSRKISDYERRFTDSIGYFQHPKGRHGHRRPEDENIVTHETADTFLEKLNAFSAPKSTVLHHKIRRILIDIKRARKRRTHMIRKYVRRRSDAKFMRYIKSTTYKNRKEIRNWHISPENLQKIRDAVKEGRIEDLDFIRQTEAQIKRSISPAGKFTLSQDQKHVCKRCVDGVKVYLDEGRKKGCLFLILGSAGTGKTTTILEIESQVTDLQPTDKADVNVLLTSTTGVSASLLYGMTIYRAAGIR